MGRPAQARAILEAAEEIAPAKNDGRGRRGATAGAVEEVRKAKGRLGHSELIRCKVRHFADGAALGSKAFVESVFAKERHRFGAKRKTGARTVGKSDGLCALRDVNKAAET